MPEPYYGDANRRLWRIMGTRWPKELWAATGQNSILLQNYNEKMSMDRHTEEGGWIHSKTSIGLEFADREKGR